MAVAAGILEPGSSFWHVAGGFTLCLVTVCIGVFDTVTTELGFSHYAEKPSSALPVFLSMPFNSLVNLGYVFLGIYWLVRDEKTLGVKHGTGRYLKNIFSWMALAYGPVQWLRISTQNHRLAVLDQWFTLPIFAWAIIWCNSILGNWSRQRFLLIECLSLISYGLSIFHRQGFELALSVHILWAVISGVRLQNRHGNSSSKKYLIFALISCLGFVGLKLLDHWLARYFLFQTLTGHFWSKVCDILQFHYAFCFLLHLDRHRFFKTNG
ncbi:PREDICTED: transmembrane protein 187 [Nanorana parkeri]|uniref:transmembrane protein 187 n=1 Tax=Nanorana parkeri TaxID=125878 RepID=UPI000854B028|nr:PREDICTED: transmembrane protein 187 [Nanorana parkeri]